MSYTFDLVRLRPGIDPDVAYRKQSKETEEELRKSLEDQGASDPQKEEAKQQLARALVTSHPSLEIFQPDFAELARLHEIDLAEARQRFRNIELNERRYSIQITLFDDRLVQNARYTVLFESRDGRQDWSRGKAAPVLAAVARFEEHLSLIHI